MLVADARARAVLLIARALVILVKGPPPVMHGQEHETRNAACRAAAENRPRAMIELIPLPQGFVRRRFTAA
ncbi:hypothetical protein [Paracoccus sp. SSK6]|uniref:hypothetical protein n=1 Tax=Paracoccus sp. SSK6 TaxID=3143131 RepID=UPI00321961B6